jgi:hypothetical protein
MIGTTILAAGVSGPSPFTWCVLDERERSTRNVWASGAFTRVGGHLVDLGLPPRPHFAFGSIPFGSLEQHAGDADDSSCVVAEILFRFGPSVGVFDDESVAPEAGENRGRVPGADTKKPCSRFDS